MGHIQLRHHPEFRRFVRFLLVGVLNTAVGYAVFALLILLGSSPAPAVIGSTIAGALFNFQSISRIVFQSRESGLLPRFLLVYTGQCGLNIALLRLAGAAGFTPLVAGAIILPLMAVLTYFAMRHFVFGAARA